MSAQLKTLNLRYMLLKTVTPFFYTIDVGGEDSLSTWNPSVAWECVSLCTNDDAIGKSHLRRTAQNSTPFLIFLPQLVCDGTHPMTPELNLWLDTRLRSIESLNDALFTENLKLVFPEMNCAATVPIPVHSCFCVRLIYSYDRSAYSAIEKLGGPIVGIYKSLTHRKKRFTSFPSPAGMSLTKLPLGRNNSVMTSLFGGYSRPGRVS